MSKVKMVQDQKVEVQVGDLVRSADFRSEFYRKVGTVTAIYHGCVRVQFGSNPAHWESTGAQWYTWVSRGDQS